MFIKLHNGMFIKLQNGMFIFLCRPTNQQIKLQNGKFLVIYFLINSFFLIYI